MREKYLEFYLDYRKWSERVKRKVDFETHLSKGS